MNTTGRAVRSALVVGAGMLAFFGASSVAIAQRSHPVQVLGPTPVPPQPTTPYPGATVTIEPGWYGHQMVPSPYGQQVIPSPHGRRPMPYPPGRHHPSAPGAVYYVPVPVAYPYYPQVGYGGGVYDTNGRPLTSGFDAPAPAPAPYENPAYTPELSGSPYVVIDGGMMVVDFGNADRRAIAACATVASRATPDGQSRTVFYRPPADGLVLRAGQRGRVIGLPTAGARVCYTVDQYGRMVLDY
jgi:hypothetical protein